jgi:putative transposase
MKDSNAEEMAMFRFGLIAPVVNATFTQPSKLAYYREVCAMPLKLPDKTTTSYSPSTLSYWENLYRKGGFEALIHKARSDKGHSRKLSENAKEAIAAIRREFPRVNATIIYERLIESGVINKHDVSLSTVQRYLKTVPGSAYSLPKKDRRAFEAEEVCGIWQADTLYGPYITDGKKKRRTYLMSIIDDKSRLVVGTRFFLRWCRQG